MRRARVLAVAAAVACLALPAAATADDIRVQSTTDTVDAGLVDGLLKAAYFRAQPGDTLQYTAVGTGAALANARNGQADVVITHAPSLEAQFVADGYSLGLGRQIFYSDYVIVGPKSDPAGVLAKGHLHDAIRAFQDIATAGEATPNAVRFTSRHDNSGTNVQEQIMWGLTTGLVLQPGYQNGGNAARMEPYSGTGPQGVNDATSFPAWFVRTNKGQAANLLDTEACVVAGNGCYTMLDRGTFNRQINAGTVTNLKIVSERNAPSAPGGTNLLINPFSVYIVNPGASFPAMSPVPNVAAATRFVNFLVSPQFQAAVAGFPSSLDPAFRPDAAPAITLDDPLPQTAALGASIKLVGTAGNRLPGGGAAKGLPIQLQRSTDGGRTWSNVGGPVSTTSSGRFGRFFAFAGTARYRLATPASAATSYNAYSPSTQDIGLISQPAAPQPSPDTLAPRVTRIKLTRTGVSLRVSEGSKVKLVIQKRVKKPGKRARWVKVQTLRLESTRARVLRRNHKVLRKGVYRVRVTVTDIAGNKRTVTKRFTRR